MRHVIIALTLALAASCGPSQVTNAGRSMMPTLQDGERAVSTSAFSTVERGDIVALRWPEDESKSFIKRVVGIPGDRLASVDGQISLNGRPLDEKYVASENRSNDSWGPLTVPADEYFVMGDNRNNSSDSRAWGTVKRKAIWAKVLRK